MTAQKSEETLLDVADAYSKTETFINKNGKNITIILGVIVGLFIAFIAYKKFVQEPKNKEAVQMMWKAEYYFDQDDFDQALNGDGNYYGFLEVVDNYGGTEAGNLAKNYAGACYLNLGDYGTAMGYFKDCSFEDVMMESTRLGAIGDCYVAEGNYDEAVSYFNRSVSHSDNEFTAPIYLKKAGLAYEELGQASKALASYERIKLEFPSTTIGRDIDKYIARASAKTN